MIMNGRASEFKAAVSSLGIPKSYQRLGAFPLDDSTVFPTISDRNSMVAGVRYQGMICYVEENDTLYLLKGGITDDCWTSLNTNDTTVETVKKYTAKEQIVAGQVVRMVDATSVEIAGVNNKYQAVLGIALNGAEIDGTVMVQVSGEASIVEGQQLQVGKQCFLGSNGNVVQTLVSSPLMLSVGTAIATNKILVSIDSEIVIFE